MILGLCGGSGAGKTTLIGQLEEKFPGAIAVIDMDNYYISHDELPFEERRRINYDVPESLDWEKLIWDIQELKAGKTILQPQFTFQTYERTKEFLQTKPAPILIVDGIFSLHKEELQNLYDLKIFVDVPADVRLARRMLRNIERYGRTAHFEVEQYFDKVKPMHEKYVEPCKKHADFLLSMENGVEKLISLLEKQMEKCEKSTENRKKE